MRETVPPIVEIPPTAAEFPVTSFPEMTKFSNVACIPPASPPALFRTMLLVISFVTPGPREPTYNPPLLKNCPPLPLLVTIFPDIVTTAPAEVDMVPVTYKPGLRFESRTLSSNLNATPGFSLTPLAALCLTVQLPMNGDAESAQMEPLR